MSIVDKIHEDIKNAMIAKNNLTRDCLRSIMSEIKNVTVNANPVKPITDEVCIKVLQKSAKTHSDSIEQFKSANRTDLLEKEEAELHVIESYLPKMLDEASTIAYIDKLINDNAIPLEKKNMGKIMKLIGGNASIDKKIVSQYLNKVLA